MSKALVAYFSASGVTARVAKNLATASGKEFSNGSRCGFV